MELAKLTLKLSGQTQNTVVKENVTPAQLALYAYIHGEDCVQSLTVTGVDKKRTVHQEMQRLNAEFSSEHAKKCLARLFPGIAPALPVSFKSIGYDPDIYSEDEPGVSSVANKPPKPDAAAVASIKEKIRTAAKSRQDETAPGATPPVAPEELAGALDDTGDASGEDGVALSDDPIDQEMNRMQEESEPA